MWSSSAVAANSSTFRDTAARLRGGAVFAGGAGSFIYNCSLSNTTSVKGEVRFIFVFRCS